MKCYLRPNMDFVEALILCENMDNIKECKKCGNPNAYFNIDRSSKNGLRYRCRECDINYRKNKHKICGIYKITSPSGKVYIGQAVDIKERFGDYNNTHSMKSQKRIYRSLVKYGVENHIFEIIEECEVEDLNCRERYWQDYYDVTGKNGLNCILQECGEQRKILSQETKDKIGNANRGKKRTDEAKEKMSKKHKGKTLSFEHIEKIVKRGVDSHFYGKRGFNAIRGKATINTSTYIIYGSARHLCETLNGKYNYNYFRSMLNGNDKNNTPYQYLEDFLRDNPNFDTTLFTYYES